MFRKVALATAISCTALLCSPVGVAGAAGVGGNPSAARPERGVAFADAADAQGALGIFHGPDGSAMVRLPLGSNGATAVAAVAAAEPGARTMPSRFTRVALTRLLSDLRARDWIVGATQYPYGMHYDAEADAVVVDTPAPTPVIDALRARFGPQVEVRPGPAGRASTYRSADESPHYGAAVLNDGLEVCTAGPTIRFGGRNYGTTANHCFRNGYSQIDSGPFFYGSTTNRPPYPAYEFQTLTGTTYPGNDYAGYIWTGNTNTGTKTRVAGAGQPCMDCKPYYFSGSTSGAIGGMVVTNMSGQLCTNDGCTYALVVADSITTDGTFKIQPGDSGAPMYAKATDGSGAAYIRGLGVGYSGTKTSYFEAWSTIANYYGATIITGT